MVVHYSCFLRVDLFCFMHQLPAQSALFPYTTLFRSVGRGCVRVRADHEAHAPVEEMPHGLLRARRLRVHVDDDRIGARSEEHTSELQSRRDIVCRLLLEKKNHLILFRASTLMLLPAT